jgi:uncharacterized protein YhdP
VSVFLCRAALLLEVQFGKPTALVSQLPCLKMALLLGSIANELDLDAWFAFLKPTAAIDTARKKEGESSPSKYVDVNVPVEITAQVKKLTLLNRHWSDLQLSANQKDAQLQMQITSPQVAGQIQWQGKKKMDIAGQLSGKLSALRIPETIGSAVRHQSGNQATRVGPSIRKGIAQHQCCRR